MSGAVLGGAFGMLEGARAASKLKVVKTPPPNPPPPVTTPPPQSQPPLSRFASPSLSRARACDAAAVVPKDAVESSVQRHGKVFPHVGGKLRRRVHPVHHEPARHAVRARGGRQLEHGLRRLPCRRSLQVSDCSFTATRTRAKHIRRCTSGFKPMATFAVGGAVIGAALELLSEGSSLRKAIFDDEPKIGRKVQQ